ncbi:MAG: hypothetical protein QM702_23855 [Rubrivivax sp.]
MLAAVGGRDADTLHTGRRLRREVAGLLHRAARETLPVGDEQALQALQHRALDAQPRPGTRGLGAAAAGGHVQAADEGVAAVDDQQFTRLAAPRRAGEQGAPAGGVVLAQADTATAQRRQRGGRLGAQRSDVDQQVDPHAGTGTLGQPPQQRQPVAVEVDEVLDVDVVAGAVDRLQHRVEGAVVVGEQGDVVASDQRLHQATIPFGTGRR